MTVDSDLDTLIARAQEGDVHAFELLLAQHLSQVRRFARAFAANPADADDLAQEALVKVYKSLRLFRFQSAFSSWLFAVVRNCFLDFAKSRASKERRSEDALEPEHVRGLPGDAPADEKLVQEQERQKVWLALRQVPVEFRTALVLFDLEGRTYDEVAAIEDVAVGTVKSRLSRGRAHLRRLLGEGEKPAADEPGTQSAPASSHPRRSDS